LGARIGGQKHVALVADLRPLLNHPLVGQNRLFPFSVPDPRGARWALAVPENDEHIDVFVLADEVQHMVYTCAVALVVDHIDASPCEAIHHLADTMVIPEHEGVIGIGFQRR
jgi:hypothetical protein